MATNGIATRANANAIVAGAYAYDTSRCVTYSSVDATELFTIIPSYSGKYTNNTNRLVLTSELEAKPKARILFKINDYTRGYSNMSSNITVSYIQIQGLKVMYPEPSFYVPILSLSFAASYFADGEIILSNTDLGNYTFNSSEAKVIIYLSNGTTFEGTCDFNPEQAEVLGEEKYIQSLNVVAGDNYLTLSIRGFYSNSNPSNPPASETVQFKVRLVFSIRDIEVSSVRIGIGDWVIYNPSGTRLASGSSPGTEYYLNQLPHDISENETEGNIGQVYYYIDLYTSTSVSNVPNNEPYYIAINALLFQYKLTNTSFIYGQAHVVNDLTTNASYGYRLLDSYNDYIKRIKLECRGVF